SSVGFVGGVSVTRGPCDGAMRGAPSVATRRAFSTPQRGGDLQNERGPRGVLPARRCKPARLFVAVDARRVIRAAGPEVDWVHGHPDGRQDVNHRVGGAQELAVERGGPERVRKGLVAASIAGSVAGSAERELPHAAQKRPGGVAGEQDVTVG